MKIQKFNEVNLNLGELDKPTKQGQLRGDVLVKKIEGEEELSLKPSGKRSTKTSIVNVDEVIPNITTDGKYDSEKSKSFFKPGTKYKKVLRGQDDEIYQLNDIEKTKEFGSSGGSSLGTVETRNVECIQCLFLSLRQFKGVSLNDSSIDELFDVGGDIKSELIRNIKIPIEINRELIEAYTKQWLNTFIFTANSLYEVRPIVTKDKDTDDNVLSSRKEYYFYQIGFPGGFNSILSEKYRSLGETRGIPISKWTPSDIWAVQKTQHSIILSRISECKSIEELNRLIDSLFDTKSLRGISLKKLKTIKKSTDLKIVFNKVTPLPTYKFKTISTSNNPLGSLGVKIICDQISTVESENHKQILDVRSSAGPSHPSDIRAEVGGDSARHGNVGLQRINVIIESLSKKYSKNFKKIPTKNDLNIFSDDDLEKEIMIMNEIILELGVGTGTGNSIKSRARLISKYQSLNFAEFIYNNLEIVDELLENIFYYALSIKNDSFQSPKYVRII